MIDKKEFLLQSIIRAYIQNLEPIGSTQLKSMYDITYSPATIRGYFKKLGDEGYLAQEHVSSGRTPTVEALKEYWLKKIDVKLHEVDLNAVQRYATEVGLTVFVRNKYSDKFNNIINVNNKYMILEFDSFSITLKFSPALYRFLNDMVGLGIDYLLNIAKQVGANELRNEVLSYLEKKGVITYNVKEFMRLALRYDFDDTTIGKFLKGKIVANCEEGIYYENLLPSGYIGICSECKILGADSKMLVVGELSKDYEYFYERVVA